MIKVRKRGEEIRHFILENLREHPRDIASVTAQEFGITRQAVNKHINFLVEQKAITVEGSTRNRQYKLHPMVKWHKFYELQEGLEEDLIWQNDIKPLVNELPDNVRDIWIYCFTEILNNAIEHSGGKIVGVWFEKTAITTEICIHDDGEGIFRKIQRELNLHDERHAVLELSKGKLTTDPARHSGEGIFFTSWLLDDFSILSGGVSFSHSYDKSEDWILERSEPKSGTFVVMNLDNNTARTSKQIFDSFSVDENYGFTKTVVPVHLAQYGNETLVSRSQAKRLLARVDRFRVVILDFSDVEQIGQAFADEIFRVFKMQHPEVRIVAINDRPEVRQMITRAESHADLSKAAT